VNLNSALSFIFQKSEFHFRLEPSSVQAGLRVADAAPEKLYRFKSGKLKRIRIHKVALIKKSSVFLSSLLTEPEQSDIYIMKGTIQCFSVLSHNRPTRDLRQGVKKKTNVPLIYPEKKRYTVQ
jgi:hypothetical protein